MSNWLHVSSCIVAIALASGQEDVTAVLQTRAGANTSQSHGVATMATGRISVELLDFSPQRMKCEADGQVRNTCTGCASGCQSPTAMLNNRNPSSNVFWDSRLAAEQWVTVDAGSQQEVKAVLSAVHGGTHHDTPWIKVYSGDAATGPWVLGATLDMKEFRGSTAARYRSFQEPVTARYFKLIIGKPTYHVLQRLLALCDTVDCETPPTPPPTPPTPPPTPAPPMKKWRPAPALGSPTGAPSTALVVETKVVGELSFTVADPAAFVANAATIGAIKEAIAAIVGTSGSDITITRYKIGTGPWQIYATRSRQLQDSLTTAGDISYDFEVSTSSSSSAAVLAAATDIVASDLVQALNTALTTTGITDTVSGASVGSPVAVVRSSADPHVTNILGQRFDIFSTGMVNLIQVPRGHGHAQSKLTVDARVDRLKTYSACNHLWIRNLRMSGSLLDDSYEFEVNAMANSFLLHAGNVSTESPEEFMKLAPAVSVHLNPSPRNAWYAGSSVAKMFKVVATVQLQAASTKLFVDLVHNAEPKKFHEHQSHLNFEASNVRRLDDNVDAIGGLLGIDDHTEAMNPEQCEELRKSRNMISVHSDDTDDFQFGSFISASGL